jgi:hypothetical protein
LRGGGGILAKAPSAAGGAAVLLGLAAPDRAHSDGLIGIAQLGRSAGREERRELSRLMRGGVPLAYRAKVWLESSRLEGQEPGVFSGAAVGRRTAMAAVSRGRSTTERRRADDAA